MKAIKQLPLFILVTLLFVSAAAAQEKSNETAATAPVVTYQSKFPVVVQGAEYDLLTMIIDFPTGAGFPKHFHGGPVLVTVMSGEITVQQGGAEKVLKTGESWTENPGDIHAVVNKGASARVAVSMLLPKGAEATTLVQ